MITDVKLTGYILPDVCTEIAKTAGDALDDAGMLFKETARAACPRSSINELGYVHLQDTIDYDVDREGTGSQIWLTMYVVKDYAHFINDGTSRMAPRPFFTNGVLAVQDGFEDVVRKRFSDLMLGHLSLPSNAGNAGVTGAS